MVEKLTSPEISQKRDWKKIIAQEAFSQTRNSLKTPEDLTSFENWRKLDLESREARQARKIVDLATVAKTLLEKEPERKEEISQTLLEFFNLKKNIASRSRVEQFQAFLLAETLGLEGPRARKEVKNFIKGLKKLKSTEGELNSLELLTSSQIDFGLKEVWFKSHLLPRLNFLARRDLEEAKKIPPPPPEKPPVEGEPPEMPELPPADQDFVKPSIEELEKKEGEPSGYFVVSPFYGGYWKEKVFEEWDAENVCFRAGLKKIKEAEKAETDEKTERAMQGIIKGKGKTPLPCAYNFAFDPESLKFPQGVEIKILEDEEKNYLLESPNEEIISFSIDLGKRKEILKTEEIPQALEIETGKLSGETEKFLEELKKEKIFPYEKARKLKQYVRNLLKYPGKGDSSYNAVFYQEPEKFFQKVEEHKKADCDVANTFFIALLSRLEIPARLATGHYIKVKDHQGRAVFSSGSGHAWTEVWDSSISSGQVGGWHRLDATPKGAPELDEEEIDEKEEDKDFEGDFGEMEAEILSDEELKEMIEEVKKMQAEKKEREKSLEEIKALNFAKEAECSPEEAKKVLVQLEKARQLKDSKGRNILDLLSREFMKIIKENLKEVPSYRAPVRLPEADELDEPVEAYIDIKAGEAEPGGFKKYEKKIEKAQEYGGFDVVLVCDKSGSMTESDPVTGEEKWKEQQKFVYLIAEALYKFSHYCKIHKIKLLNPIDVRTGLITFQAGGYEAVLPFSDSWRPKEQYKLWQKLGENIGGGTPDYLGLAAAQKMILEDKEKQKGKNKEELKKRLRLVIVTADGGSDNKKAVQNNLKILREKDIIVEGVGLTEAAKEIEATYYPHGKCLKSAREMPEWVAEKIITQVKKLYPQKIKK